MLKWPDLRLVKYCNLPIYIYTYTYTYPLWLFNIAMEHDPFIDDVHDVPVKMVIFHGYGSTWIEAIWMMP